MTRKAEGKYHHGDLRRALLDAAILAIDDGGPKNFSLRALAQGLNVSHAAAYRHFRNRDDLLRAVSIEGMQRLQATLYETARQAAGPADTMRRCALAYVQFGLSYPGLYHVMFSEISKSSEDTRGASDAVLAVTAQIIAQAQVEGAVTPGDPWEHARAAWAMVHGLVDLELRKQLTARSPARIMEHNELLLETFFSGLFTE